MVEVASDEPTGDGSREGESPTSSAELVRRARNGDESSARELFDRYRKPVLGHCMVSTDGDRDAAKDLLQESFAKVFDHLDDLENPDQFSSWLWTIVRRACADRGSQRSRHREVLERFAFERDVFEEGAGADKELRERRIACVQRILDDVDDEQLEAIVKMKYTPPEHTTREIAEELDMPHGTVTVKLMRFRESIEDELTEALRDVGAAAGWTGGGG